MINTPHSIIPPSKIKGFTMVDIAGYKDKYKVDEEGNVFSVRANKNLKSFHKNNEQTNYKRVCLQLNGTQKKFFIHRLVAEAYLPNAEEKPFVNHKNGIRTDNRVENLEWATAQENTSHAYATGLMKPTKGIKFSNNTSGYVGVTRSGNKWKAQIRHGGELMYLGLYKTPREASDVYQQKLKEYA